MAHMNWLPIVGSKNSKAIIPFLPFNLVLLLPKKKYTPHKLPFKEYIQKHATCRKEQRVSFWLGPSPTLQLPGQGLRQNRATP